MMKRVIYGLLAIMIAAGSCAKEKGAEEPEGVEISLNVGIPVPGRTSYSEDGGALKCAWNDGDCISIISLKDGKVETVDNLTTVKGGSSEAVFTGMYSGKQDADVICIYPAFKVFKDQFCYSGSACGNSCGYFRIFYGGSYIAFAPEKGMAFLQTANSDSSHVSALDLMYAPVTLSSGKVMLTKQIGLIRCVLDIPDAGQDEHFSSLTLSLDNGAPFTDYMATMGLSFSSDRWAVESGKRSFTMGLDGITLNGHRMTVYVPAVPNSADNSFGGQEQRRLTVTATSDRAAYEGHKDIPAGAVDDLLIEKGRVNEICAVLEERATPPPPPAEPIGEARVFNTASGNSLTIDGQYLFAGTSGKIYIYNVSEPMSPSQVAVISFQGQARQMTVYEGKLFVTARETGTWIYDITDISSPVLIDRYDCVELATGLDVAGNCMFVGQRQNGVEFVDISDPSNAAHIRIIDTDESQSVFYADGYLYSGEWGTGKITVFDARDLSNLSIVKTCLLQGYGDGLWVSGNRLYVSTGHHHKNSAPKKVEGDGHGAEIWDLTNPADPKFISRVEFDIFYKSGTDCWMLRPAGDGKTLFCGDVYNGMYLVDITDETKPSVIKRYQSPAKQAIQSLAIGDGVVYVAAGGDGFIAIESPLAVRAVRDRGTLPVNESARYTYPASTSGRFHTWIPQKRGMVHAAVPYGEVLYVACGDGGLAILKKDASGKPYLYAAGESEFAGGVAVRGDRLYVAEGDRGFAVYRIGSDFRLSLILREKNAISSREDTRICFWISAPNDKYIMAGSRYRGYQCLYNNGTDYAPSYVNKLQKSVNVNYNKYIAEECCAGDLLPYATRSGFVWFNLSTNKATASETNTSIAVSASDGVTLFRNGTALYTKDNAFHIIESGALSPSSSSGSNSYFKGIPRWDGANRIQVTNFMSNYISVADISNFSSPVLEYTETTSGKPEAGCFWDGKAVFPCGYQGLLIEK